MTIFAILRFRIVVSFDLNENTNQDESTLPEDAEDQQQYAEDDHEIMGKVTVKFSGRVKNHQLKEQNVTLLYNGTQVIQDTKGTLQSVCILWVSISGTLSGNEHHKGMFCFIRTREYTHLTSCSDILNIKFMTSFAESNLSSFADLRWIHV